MQRSRGQSTDESLRLLTLGLDRFGEQSPEGLGGTNPCTPASLGHALPGSSQPRKGVQPLDQGQPADRRDSSLFQAPMMLGASPLSPASVTRPSAQHDMTVETTRPPKPSHPLCLHHHRKDTQRPTKRGQRESAGKTDQPRRWDCRTTPPRILSRQTDFLLEHKVYLLTP